MVNDVTLKDVITMCLDMDIDEYKESRKKCPLSKRAPRLCVVEGCDGSASAKGGLCYTPKNKNDAAGVARRKPLRVQRSHRRRRRRNRSADIKVALVMVECRVGYAADITRNWASRIVSCENVSNPSVDPVP